MANNTIEEVITLKQALEILQCAKTKFYEKYFPLLNSKLDEKGYRRLYSLNEVNELANRIEAERGYKLVRK